MIASIVNIIAGIWLMISPFIFTADNTKADFNYICGPLIIAFSIISLWEVNRKVQKVNIIIAISLLISLLFVAYGSKSLALSNLITALLVLVMALLKRTSKHSYGGGWISLLQSNHGREKRIA